MKQTALIVLLGLIPVLAQAQSEKYALLVGVTKYQHARMNDTQLKYPENDAAAVAVLLKASGYEVKVLVGRQATQAAIGKALKAAQSKSNSDGVLLVGLFGHGVQYQEDAYFGPYDTSIRVVKDSQGKVIRLQNGQPRLEPDPASMISMKQVLETLALSAAGNKILLADCCREDPSAARGRAFGTNVEAAALPPGTAVFFSCSQGERAYEHDDWKHGAFTKAFLDTCRAMSATGKVRTSALSGKIYDSVLEMVKDKAQDSQKVYYRTNGTVVDLQLKDAFRPATNITNSIGMKLKLIPVGSFMMGSRLSAEALAKKFGNQTSVFKDENSQNRVEISQPFYAGVHEVTLGQFRQFVRGSGYQTEAEQDGNGGWGQNLKTREFEQNKDYSWKNLGGIQQLENEPVVNVTWNDAVAFCAWLSRQEGIDYRLPTEAEREYCCRAGSTGLYQHGDNAEGLVFVGNVADGTAKEKFPSWPTISAKDGYVFTAPVGRFRANDFGLHDMHGNVWEWCSDWYDDKDRDPKDPSGGSVRVFRGGGWFSPPQDCRSAFCLKFSPSYRSCDLGFRVLRSSGK